MYAWGKKSKSVSFSRVYVCVKAKLTLVSFVLLFFCTFPSHENIRDIFLGNNFTFISLLYIFLPCSLTSHHRQKLMSWRELRRSLVTTTRRGGELRMKSDTHQRDKRRNFQNGHIIYKNAQTYDIAHLNDEPVTKFV